MIGIYFLIRNRKIVYIGQSKNVEKRLKSHLKKEYDSVRVIQCAIESLSYYEKRWIKLFKPELNGLPGGRRLGAGRPKSEPTVVIRVPVRLLEKIKKIISC